MATTTCSPSMACVQMAFILNRKMRGLQLLLQGGLK
jgi:hypothetical protein